MNEAFAKLLKSKRVEKGLCHRQVAEYIARTRTGYLTLEQGAGRFHLDEAIVLMSVLGIKWEEYVECLDGAKKLER